MGTVGTALRPEEGPGERPKAVDDAERAAEGRPEIKTTEGRRRIRTHNKQQVARRRQQWLFFDLASWECNPKAATPLNLRRGRWDRRCRSGGIQVSPESTAKTGLTVASVVGKNGAPPRRSSPV